MAFRGRSSPRVATFTRHDNRRTGRASWVPAMRGGHRTDIRRAERDYLPLTAEVVAPHTSRNKRIGLCPPGGDWVLVAGG